MDTIDKKFNLIKKILKAIKKLKGLEELKLGLNQ